MLQDTTSPICFACVHMYFGVGESQLHPVFMTEVNVDRSKPCSQMAVGPPVSGYSPRLEVASMLKVGAYPALKTNHSFCFVCQRTSIEFCPFF